MSESTTQAPFGKGRCTCTKHFRLKDLWFPERHWWTVNPDCEVRGEQSAAKQAPTQMTFDMSGAPGKEGRQTA